MTTFEQTPDIRALYGSKWTTFAEDVLPMWIADMDFPSPPAIQRALIERAQSGMLGYTLDYPPLKEVVVARMQRLYGWDITPQDILLIPGMVVALNMVTRALGKAGEGVLMQTPVYGPFLTIPANNGLFAQAVDLVATATGQHTFAYHTDFDALERAITKQTRLFYLCSPHNPGGFIYSREELAQLAEICLRNHVTIVADEIHSDLILEGAHTPIATLSPEVAQQTITLIAPSKTYNMPGLACSVAIIQNAKLRQKVAQQVQAMGLHVNVAGLVAATAAYQEGDAWLSEVLTYLRGNRDFLVAFVSETLPEVKTTVPAATYLAWLDASALPTPDGQSVAQFLLEKARVAVNNGDFFRTHNAQSGRDGFIRINFACPRPRLEEGLTRIARAVKG